MQTTSQKNTWESYTSCWGETNQKIRLSNLSDNLIPTCIYSDVNTETDNIENLSTYMAGFQSQFPGSHFVTTDFKEHHNQSLAHWNMIDKDGKVIGQGASYAAYENGKLKKMTGFF